MTESEVNLGELMQELTEDNYKDVLLKCREIFVSTIDPDRQFLLMRLMSKGFLDEEDYQLIINGGKTRQQRVVKFLDILACKGFEACHVFLGALAIEYPHLSKQSQGRNARTNVSQHAIVSGTFYGGDSALKCSTELGDLERQLLVQRLERLTKDLFETSCWYQKTIEEKREVENELTKLKSELESKDYYINCLEKQLQARDKAQEKGSAKIEEMTGSFIDFQQVHVRALEKDKLIAELTGSIWAMDEELCNSRRKEEELKNKNSQLTNQVRDLTISYESERRNSRKLNETVKTQSQELSQTAQLRRQLLDEKFKLGIALEEKEALEHEFEEFRKWVEVLNSRFDKVQLEKNEVTEVRDAVSRKYVDLCNTVYLLECKVHDLDLQREYYQQNNSRLKAEVNLRIQEKQLIVKKMEAVVNEREAACNDRDGVLKQMAEIQFNREMEMKEQRALYEKAEENMTKARQQLEKSEEECKELKKKLADADSKIMTYDRLQSFHFENVSEEDSEEKAGNGDKKPRASKDLLQSLRRRAQDASEKSVSLPHGFGRHMMTNGYFLPRHSSDLLNFRSISPPANFKRNYLFKNMVQSRESDTEAVTCSSEGNQFSDEKTRDDPYSVDDLEFNPSDTSRKSKSFEIPSQRADSTDGPDSFTTRHRSRTFQVNEKDRATQSAKLMRQGKLPDS